MTPDKNKKCIFKIPLRRKLLRIFLLTCMIASFIGIPINNHGFDDSMIINTGIHPTFTQHKSNKSTLTTVQNLHYHISCNSHGHHCCNGFFETFEEKKLLTRFQQKDEYYPNTYTTKSIISENFKPPII